MGGVNLSEESKNILATTDSIGAQQRSCKDEVFIPMSSLQKKINAIGLLSLFLLKAVQNFVFNWSMYFHLLIVN